MTSLPPGPIVETNRWALRDGRGGWGPRSVAQETAVALTYNRMSYAVMMASPCDLEDFGVGFSLSEGIVASVADIEELEVHQKDLGIEIRMTIAPALAGRLHERRRHMAGPVGCGLCGVESLKDAMRALPKVASSLSVSSQDILEAVAALSKSQPINSATSAVHAAAFWQPGQGLVAIREDVGRHNALDKLTGSLARAKTSAQEGLVVISSRVSVEMVQKTAMMGAPVLVAVSAPTALAIKSAEEAEITLVAVARGDGFEVFTGHQRLILNETSHVA